MSAVRMQVLQEILRILREEVNFTPDPNDVATGMATEILPTSINFRKVSVADRDIDLGKVTEELPGVFVSMPSSEPFNVTAATNSRDEYAWQWLIQIVDGDQYEKTENIATYLLWQERINKKFQFNNLLAHGTIDSARCLAMATSVDVVDERYWLKEFNFKSGVMVTTLTWLRRDNGSN